MTTAQESTNGHRVFPLPLDQEDTQSGNSTNNKFNSTPVSPTPSTEAFPASAYHVPPKPFTPNPKLDQPNDYSERAKRLEPLPERCQFMFSDGRQCTMARSDIHPSLCTYHSDREQQLFGDPSCRCEARTLDFPELYSASNDLTTAAGVNRALAQVFRMLAQRRISRQEAATFAKLGHLLLQSISAARSSRESHPPIRMADQELSPVNKVQRRISQIGSHSATQHQNGASERQLDSPNAHSSASPVTPAALSEPQPVPAAVTNSLGINPSATSVCNSRAISTYENTELKVVHNEHLRKNGRAV